MLPGPYYAKVPLVDKRTGNNYLCELPFLLPHEQLHAMLTVTPTLLTELVPVTMVAFLSQFAAERHLDVASVAAIGLHGDGVPFAAKMSDSIEELSWNLCGDEHQRRVLFTCVPKSFCAGRPTYDALFEVFRWSMECCAEGRFPTRRHDGAAWLDSDRSRQKQQGAALNFHAVLLQVRADWAWLNQVFSFPSWSSKQICWRCRATKNVDSEYDFRQCGSNAPWRNARLSEAEFFNIQREQGILVSPLFKCPGFQLKFVVTDWLHCMDLGLAQHILGNTFYAVLVYLPGANQADRVTSLWKLMREFYAKAKPASQLQGLTLEMLKQPGKPPKLRSKAAQCRYLVPFCSELADRFKDKSDVMMTVSHLTRLLDTLVRLVCVEPFDSSAAAEACRRLCLLYCALFRRSEAIGEDRWRATPKLHMVQEMLEFDAFTFGSPKSFWTYVDESWGGHVAKIATRRGGAKLPASIALEALDRFRASFKTDARDGANDHQ